jgi:hypothetical protein
MSAADEVTFHRGATIIAQSRVAILVGAIGRRMLAAVRTSCGFAATQRRIQAFRGPATAERVGCALLVTATAVAGHVVLASMLPAPARPATALTALVLLAICLAAGATAVRRP